jgi:hypothetical protein
VAGVPRPGLPLLTGAVSSTFCRRASSPRFPECVLRLLPAGAGAGTGGRRRTPPCEGGVCRFCRLPSWLTVRPSARSWWRAQGAALPRVPRVVHPHDTRSVSLALSRPATGVSNGESGLLRRPL